MADDQPDVGAIRDHYDRLSVYYRALWGDHIHHGYWEDHESPAAAQMKLVERLAARARIPRGARILDVGCGVGGPALWLARHLDCSVLGLTISPVQAEMATQRARAEHLDHRARFEVADANDLELVPGTFDAVWVVECSEHLADKPRFIEACARVLRPDGVQGLAAWLVAEASPSPAQALLVAEVCRGMLCPSLATLGAYTGWLRSSGFVVVEAEDVTRRVEPTWQWCGAIADRPVIRAVLRASDPGTRRFIEAFAAIRRAYAEGAMAYGLFVARRA